MSLTPARRAAIEREITMMREMQSLVHDRARGVRAPAFQAFATLMGEYVELCTWSLQHDVDYVAEAPRMDVEAQESRHLGETLGSLFAPWLQSSSTRAAFVRAALAL